MIQVLDAFCGAGGATRGYQLAGAEVTGVDIEPQKYYIGEGFYRTDAVRFIEKHGHEFDFIHTSPPCQAFTNAQKIQGREHPDLVTPTREALASTGRPWVIENVKGAPLLNPVELCGCMFPALNVYRERLFEFGGWTGPRPLPHQPHVEPLVKMGRAPKPGHRMYIVGNFIGAEAGRKAMGIDWMPRGKLREAIPPAYTEYIGKEFVRMLREAA